MKRIKELYLENGNQPFIFNSSMIADYPEIEGNESDFISDYLDVSDALDRFFVMEYGKMVYDGIFGDSLEEFKKDVSASIYMNFYSWARLYYALSLAYNPLYNVDGSTTRTYSEHTIDDTFGERETTFTKGNQQNTEGVRENNTTTSETSYDSGLPKESGRSNSVDSAVTNSEGQRIDTTEDAEYTNTRVSGEHMETETRKGNIGVTKSTELMESEWEFRRRNFFRDVFKTIAKDVGLLYPIDWGCF